VRVYPLPPAPDVGAEVALAAAEFVDGAGLAASGVVAGGELVVVVATGGVGAGAAGTVPWIVDFCFFPNVPRALRVARALATPVDLALTVLSGTLFGVKPND
jgi:hypothetical protein